MRRIDQFLEDRSGASAIEYGLLVTLIALGLIALLSAIGVDVATFFAPVSDTL